MNFNDFLMLDIRFFGFNQKDKDWIYELYDGTKVCWHTVDGKRMFVVIGMMVRRENKILFGKEMRIYPCAIYRPSDEIRFLPSAASECLVESMFKNGNVPVDSASVQNDEIGWHVRTIYNPKYGMHRPFIGVVDTIGEIYGNKKLNCHEAKEVVNLFNEKTYFSTEIKSNLENNKKHRDNIVSLCKKISEDKDEIERKSMACAEALNELEKVYHITNIDDISEFPDKRIGELISDVRIGYDAMDENGALNKNIKNFNNDINDCHYCIERNEQFIRESTPILKRAIEKLRMYGYKVKLEV